MHWRCSLRCGLAATGLPLPARPGQHWQSLTGLAGCLAGLQRTRHIVAEPNLLVLHRSSFWLAWVGLTAHVGILQPAFLWLGRAVTTYLAVLALDMLWAAADRRRPRKCDVMQLKLPVVFTVLFHDVG